MAPFEADPLLSELCRICNTNPTKYCCPGCSIRTCSLACAKRHKAWYQCSGLRNPAAYVKSKDLATPAGIDRDFNFLTGIERAFDEADRDAEARGIVVGKPERPRPFSEKGKIPRQEAIDRTRVIVDRAPKGMTREKDNKTRWIAKQKCLSWTVEWIHHDGSRELTDCLDTFGLSGRYATLLSMKQPREKHPPKRKLKRKHDPGLTVNGIADPTIKSGTTLPAGGAAEPVEDAKGASESAAEPALLQPFTSAKEYFVESPHVGSERKSPDQYVNPPADDVQITTTDKPSKPPQKDPEAPPDYYFYLLRPHTTSSSLVLIPVSPSIPLREILKDRIVLEFPTIYALKHAPSALPEGFILESEYLGQSEAEAQELDELLSRVKAPDLEEGEVEDGEKALQEAMDKKRLLDVLRKDLSVGR
ncbi:MAG: hypothetical protein M1812_001938 [Candelaria pacifica]|nr:MAG: hypothetical protein M1812_001938 [Candelaria pacifica]